MPENHDDMPKTARVMLEIMLMEPGYSHAQINAKNTQYSSAENTCKVDYQCTDRCHHRNEKQLQEEFESNPVQRHPSGDAEHDHHHGECLWPLNQAGK